MTTPDTPRPVSEHLREMRRRIFICIGALACGALAAIPFQDQLLAFIMHPLREAFGPEISLVALTPFEAWIISLKLALVVGAVIALPIIIWQAIAFWAPACRNRSPRATPILILALAGMFLAGAAFCYKLILPGAYRFAAANMDDALITFLPHASAIVTFTLRLLLAFGIAFELPFIVALLIRLNLVSPDRLSRARPFVIIGAFILGALLTPPDVITQVMLALPLMVLFELGLLLGRWLARRRRACPAPSHLV